MRTPKFLDRMRNKGFEEVPSQDPEGQVIFCRAGNIVLSRLFTRNFVNPETGRPDMRTTSSGAGRIAFFKEKGTEQDAVIYSDDPNPTELVLNGNEYMEDTRTEYNDAIAQNGEVAVTLIGSRNAIEASAKEVCSICLTNRDNRCSEPRAPFKTTSLEELMALAGAVNNLN